MALILVLRFPLGLPFEEEMAFAATHGVVWHGLMYTLPAAVLASGIPPFLGMIATVGVVAAIVAYRFSISAGLLLALLPFGVGVYGTVLNAHWFTGILLALILISPRRWDALIAAVCVLNGPAGIVLAPIYALRARRHPVLSGVVMVGAALQLVVLLTSGRESHGADPLEVLVVSVVRLGMAPLGEMPIIPVLWLLTLPAFAIAARRLPRPMIGVLVYYSVATVVAGLLTTQPERLWIEWAESRYFIAASWTMLLAATLTLFAGTRWQRTRGGTPTSWHFWSQP